MDLAALTSSPYDVLQIPATATWDEIRAAYRGVAKRWHPDRCPNDASATRRFQAITAAYEAVASTDRSSSTGGELMVWRASRDDEAVVLTSARLLHRVGERTWEIAICDVRAVLVRPLPHHVALLLVQTRSGTHRLCLPYPLALRLGLLLS